MSENEDQLIDVAKCALQELFDNWNSSFRQRISVQKTRNNIVEFNVVFSRCNDQDPVPRNVVNVLFFVEVVAGHSPSIGFQIEGEQYIYKIPKKDTSKNIDELINSNLEFKQRLRDAFTPQIMGNDMRYCQAADSTQSKPARH